MRFRLLQTSTLDVLEGPLHTLFQKTSSFGANHENLDEDDPYYQ